MNLAELETDRPYRLGNVWVKVTQGSRGKAGDADRIIWVSTGDSYVPVTMEAVAGVAALIAENEDTVYPQPRYHGGNLWRMMLAIAVKDGLRAAMKFKKGTYGSRTELTRCLACGTLVTSE